MKFEVGTGNNCTDTSFEIASNRYPSGTHQCSHADGNYDDVGDS